MCCQSAWQTLDLSGGLLIKVSRLFGEFDGEQGLHAGMQVEGFTRPAGSDGAGGWVLEAVHRSQSITLGLALENLRRWQQVLADALGQTSRLASVQPSLIISGESPRELRSPLRDERPIYIPDHTVAGKAWMCRRRYRVGGMLTECRGSTRSRR